MAEDTIFGNINNDKIKSGAAVSNTSYVDDELMPEVEIFDDPLGDNVNALDIFTLAGVTFNEKPKNQSEFFYEDFVNIGSSLNTGA